MNLQKQNIQLQYINLEDDLKPILSVLDNADRQTCRFVYVSS